MPSGSNLIKKYENEAKHAELCIITQIQKRHHAHRVLFHEK